MSNELFTRYSLLVTRYLFRASLADDELVARLLLLAGLKANRFHASGRNRAALAAANRGAAFATTVWVVVGVHRFTTHVRLDATVAHTACVAPHNGFPLRIANYADGGAAFAKH